MFEVQKYLLNNSLEDLQREYMIKANICTELGVVSLNYNQLYSDMANPIVQECRALILELDTWDIVSRSFNKFFNYSEPNAASTVESFDWNSSIILDKVDGSLIPVYFYKDVWRISTRSVANAECECYREGIDETISFKDLVLLTMKEMDFSFNELNPDILYSFELTTPYNQLVIQYSGFNLTWLAAWDRLNPEREIPIWNLPNITAPRVKVYPAMSPNELLDKAKTMSISEGEGFVVVDKNFRRLKLKSDDYLKTFRVSMAGRCVTLKRKLDFILSDQYDDIYAVLSDDRKKEMDRIKAAWDNLIRVTLDTFDEVKHITDRKEFAQVVGKYFCKSWLFKLYDGLSIEEVVQHLMLSAKVKMLEAYQKSLS